MTKPPSLMSGESKLGRRRAASASGSTPTVGPSGASPSCFGMVRGSSIPCSATLAAASRTTSTCFAAHHSTRSSMVSLAHRSP
eukprot:9638415-Lingulodinium_polyedra.AAC.1